MSRAQRLTFLGIALVIAIVAVFFLTSRDAGDERSTTTSATATPTGTATATPGAEATETATPTPTPTPRPQPPLLQSGKETKLRFEQGETIRFRVRSDVDEEIHVHGYDVTKAIPAGRTTTVSFKAEITGIFEIEFHGTGELIGQLRVDP